MKNIITILLIILAFIGGYFFSQKYSFKIEEKTTPTLIIIPSEKPTSSIPTSTPTFSLLTSPTIDETENLKTVIKQLLIQEHGPTANNMVITVSQIVGDYAKGMASESGGGGIWLATKIGGNWKLIFNGNGIPDCNALKNAYLFPQEILTNICD